MCAHQHGLYNVSTRTNFAGARAENFVLNAGDTVTVNTINLITFLLTINGAIVSANPNGSVSFIAATPGGHAFVKTVSIGPTPGSVTFTCVPFAAGPTPTPTPGDPAPGTTPEMTAALVTTTNRNPELADDFFNEMLEGFPGFTDCRPAPQSQEEYNQRFEALLGLLDDPSVNIGASGVRCEIETLGKSEFYRPGDSIMDPNSVVIINGFDPRVPMVDYCETPPKSQGEYNQRLAALQKKLDDPSFSMNADGGLCELQTLSQSQYDRAGDSIMQYVAPQSRATPSTVAISQFFASSGSALGGDIPLGTGPGGWKISLSFDGGAVDRAFAALTQHAIMASARLGGVRRLNDRTVLGVGLVIGGGQTVMTNPGGTINTATFGTDIGIMRRLGSHLYGGLYAGYTYSAHQGTIAGVVNTYGDHAFKAGGRLQGSWLVNAFTITPSVSLLIQSHHQPGYVTGAGVAMPALGFFELDGRTGVSLSRAFAMGSGNGTVTPFIGINAVLDHDSLTPVLVGTNDWFRGELTGGFTILWLSGASLTIAADVSRGANSTEYGVNGTVSIPLH